MVSGRKEIGKQGRRYNPKKAQKKYLKKLEKLK